MSAEHEADWVKVIKVYSKATTRMQNGANTYGEFNPATDPRDLLTEAQEELLDAINYLGMQHIKLDEMRRKLDAYMLR